MEKLFVEKDINITKKQVDNFLSYYETLVFYNSMFNITAITEKEEVYKKHFIDSVLGLDKIKGNSLLDIGSGGGFPAIPIKIMNENIHLTMMDATLKKCEFLKTVCRELGLENVTVINGRAEEYAFKEGFRESFDHVSARAVARLNILSEYCLPFVKIGGQFISYKSGEIDDEISSSKSAVFLLGGKVKDIIKFELGESGRSFIVINKINGTPKTYPRKAGTPSKKPL